MEIKEAIMAFSQSEKVKSGLIWISQTLESLRGLNEAERKGAEKVAVIFLNMLGHEIGLAQKIAAYQEWEGLESDIEKSIIMVNSGVGDEATIHISQALSKVTSIAQQAMTFLREKELL